MRKASEYTKEICDVMKQVHLTCHLYQGKDGAKRFAREYGACLVDFPEDEAKIEIRSSYNTVCVLGYYLKPPIDAKDWMKEVEVGYKRGKEMVQ